MIRISITLAAFVAIAATMPLGLAGGAGALTTITPQPSVAFTQSSAAGSVNVGLKPNGGGTGPFQLPSTVTNSWAIYAEAMVDPNFGTKQEYLLGNSDTSYRGVHVDPIGSGPPQIVVQNIAGNNFFWWPATTGASAVAGLTFTKSGSGYNQGIYTWQASGACTVGAGAREPQGTVMVGDSGAAYVVDPGFLCGARSTSSPASLTNTTSPEST
jgi:hypothetical protein